MPSRAARIATLLVGALAAGLLFSVTSNASPRPDPAAHAEEKVPYGQYNFKNYRFDMKCLARSSTSGDIVLFECRDNWYDQYWYYPNDDSTVPGYARLRNRDTGECLAAPGWNDGDPAIAFTCRTNEDQYWKLESTPESTYRLRNYRNGKCLEGAEDNWVVLYTCTNDRPRQWWRLARRS